MSTASNDGHWLELIGAGTAENSLFRRISGIIGISEKKRWFPMPQSEMEALIQL